MVIHNSCQSAIESCLASKTFAIARLYNDEKTMGIHIHDCYEIYFSISGGKQFLIDNRVYTFEPGDIFFINQFESHYLSHVDERTHMRIVISIYPEFLKRMSTEHTDLNYCFVHRDPAWGHKVSLTAEERKRFMYFIHQLSEEQEFGQDVLDHAVFLGLMTFLNRVFLSRCTQEPDFGKDDLRGGRKSHYSRIDEILDYINQHLAEELSVSLLAAQFYVSSSHLHKIFKEATGTTINRYITAKRISRAKALLAEGYSVTETGGMCGFHDYSNFLKSFTKATGVSPKKYASFTQS